MNARSNGFDCARGLVAEEEREAVADATLAVMQIGVAHTAGPDADQNLAGTGIGNVNGHHLHGGSSAARDDAGDRMWHDTDLTVRADCDVARTL